MVLCQVPQIRMVYLIAERRAFVSEMRPMIFKIPLYLYIYIYSLSTCSLSAPHGSQSAQTLFIYINYIIYLLYNITMVNCNLHCIYVCLSTYCARMIAHCASPRCLYNHCSTTCGHCLSLLVHSRRPQVWQTVPAKLKTA